MTQQEIIEGNKLIAEFMGGFYEDVFVLGVKQRPDFWQHKDKGNPLLGLRYTDKTLEYHFNWQWLMPVIEKIEKLGFYTQINGCASSICHYCWIEEGDDSTFKVGLNGKDKESKILVVFQAIIKFIKWYNEEKNY